MTNIAGEDYTGTVYSYTTQPGTLVLQVTASSVTGCGFSYKFFRTSQIKELNVLSKTIDPSAVAEIHQIDPKNMPKIIQRNKENFELVKKTRNENAGREGQTIFNAVYKTMPSVRWSGDSIVVLEEVKIDPPYRVDSIRSLDQEEDGAAQLVKKIVDGVWLKMENERKGG